MTERAALVGVLVADAGWVARAVDPALDRAGVVVDWIPRDAAVARAGAPDVVLVDLDRADALDVVDDLRARWPTAVVSGYLSRPDPERWVDAQRRGCDLVVNRGALPRALGRRLASAGTARLYPLCDAADLAGRLGLVARVDDTPVGPVAVYQVDRHVVAAADRCPHAGAVLSEGELEGAVVTCPRHGSRFDVITGARVRGPSDDPIAVHRTVTTNGQVFLVLSDGDPLSDAGASGVSRR